MGNQESYPEPSGADSLRHFLIQSLYLLKPHHEWSSDDIDQLLARIRDPSFGSEDEIDRDQTDSMLYSRFVSVAFENNDQREAYDFFIISPGSYVVTELTPDGESRTLVGVYTWPDLVSFILNDLPPFEFVAIRSGYDPSDVYTTRIYGCKEGATVPVQGTSLNANRCVFTNKCMARREDAHRYLSRVQALARKKITQRRNRNVTSGLNQELKYRPPSGAFPGGEGYQQSHDEFSNISSRYHRSLKKSNDEEKE
jgi:hypothetical protein